MAGMSHRFLASIDWAMAVNPEDRPVSVTALRMALNGEIEPSVPSRHTATPVPAAPSPEGFWPVTAIDPPRAASGTTPHEHKRSATRVTAAVATLVLCTAAFGTWTLSQREAATPVAATPAVPAPTAIPAATVARAAVGPAIVVSAAEPVSATASPTPIARARDTTVAALTAKPKASAAGVTRPKATSTTLDSRPLDECAEKNFLLRSLCVRQACEQPQLRMHSRCVEIRAEDEARAQSQLNR